MKTLLNKKLTTLVITILLFVIIVHAQNTFPSTGAAGIGTTTPNASSLFEMKSTSKGLLISRMTKNQRDAIAIPATGLLIYQTNSTPGFYYYDGSKWTAVSSKSANQSLSNLSTTSINTSLAVSTGDTFDLGSSGKNWRTLYVDGILINGAANLSTYNHNLYYGGGGSGTGQLNTGLGLATLSNLTTGFYNTAVGDQSLNANTTGNYNVGVGTYSLTSNNTGYDNVAIGAYALNINTNGYSNTATGHEALFQNTSGNSNTANGVGALLQNDNGSNNTAVGLDALAGNISGNYNTGLGENADVSAGNLVNATAIGYGAIATASNQVMLGNTSVTSVMAAGSITIVSDGRFKKNIKENVPGLAFINQLKPVTYNYDIHGLNNLITPTNTASKKSENSNTQKGDEAAISAKEKIIYTGFVAQDVEAVAKNLNYDFSGVHKPQNNKDPYALSYSDFVVPLVKAVQELSKMNDKKDSMIHDLQKQINELRSMFSTTSQPQNATTVFLTSASIEQNIPNPFNNTTTIHYTLPQSYSSAKIIITDINGRSIKELNIHGTGSGSLNITSLGLTSGNYNYSLYINGRLVATKQMTAGK